MIFQMVSNLWNLPKLPCLLKPSTVVVFHPLPDFEGLLIFQMVQNLWKLLELFVAFVLQPLPWQTAPIF